MTAGAEGDGTGTGIGRPPWWFIVAALLAVLAVGLFLWFQPLGRKPVRVAPPPPGWTLQPVLALTGPGVGGQPRFDRPLAAAFGPDGDIYVSDTNHGRICVFTADGRFKQEIGRMGNRAGWLRRPVGLSVDASGGVLVADLAAGVVRAFGPGGQPGKSLPQPENGWHPTDVAAGPSGIFVTDDTAVRRFSAAGTFEGSVPTSQAGSFEHPNGVAITPAGGLVVSDTNDSMVISIGASGTVLWQAGAQKGVALPRGIAVGPDGRVYVADAFAFEVAMFDAKGSLMAKVGERGTAVGQFSFPNDVDVRGDLLLVTDKENDRVQLLRLIPPPSH